MRFLDGKHCEHLQDDVDMVVRVNEINQTSIRYESQKCVVRHTVAWEHGLRELLLVGLLADNVHVNVCVNVRVNDGLPVQPRWAAFH